MGEEICDGGVDRRRKGTRQEEGIGGEGRRSDREEEI